MSLTEQFSVSRYPIRLYPCILQKYRVPDQVSRRTVSGLYNGLDREPSVVPFRYAHTVGLPPVAVRYRGDSCTNHRPVFFELRSKEAGDIIPQLDNWGMKFFSIPSFQRTGIVYLVEDKSYSWAHGLQQKLDAGIPLTPKGSERIDTAPWMENIDNLYLRLGAECEGMDPMPVMFRISPEMEAECLNNGVPLMSYEIFGGMAAFHLTPVHDVREIMEPVKLIKMISRPFYTCGYAEGLYRGESGRFYYTSWYGHTYEVTDRVAYDPIRKTIPETCGTFDMQNYAISAYGGCMVDYFMQYDPEDHLNCPKSVERYDQSKIYLEIAGRIRWSMERKNIRCINDIPAVSMLNESLLDGIKAVLNCDPSRGSVLSYFYSTGRPNPNYRISASNKFRIEAIRYDTDFTDAEWGNAGSTCGMGIALGCNTAGLGLLGYSSEVKCSPIEDSNVLSITKVKIGVYEIDRNLSNTLWNFLRRRGFRKVIVIGPENDSILQEIHASAPDMQVIVSPEIRPVMGSNSRLLEFDLRRKVLRDYRDLAHEALVNESVFQAIVDDEIRNASFGSCVINPRPVIEKIIAMQLFDENHHQGVCRTWFG